MQLNYKTFGDNGEPLIILHGLMGSLDNWQTIARQLSSTYRVFIVDQRNHGKSPHVPQMSYPLMANDLLEFMQQQHLDKAHLLGHSMGGKTVMEFTLKHPGKVMKQVVADMAPKAYPPHHDAIFEAMFSVDLDRLTSRADAETVLACKIDDPSMRQFLLKSLDRLEDGTYEWKMNLPVLHSEYENIIASITPGKPVDTPTLVIRGEKSGYVKLEDIDLFKQYFPNTKMVTLNTGHWVHAEAPKEFLEAVSNFLAP